MAALETQWEGSRNFGPAVRLARAISFRSGAAQTDEEALVGGTMGGILEQARPIVCPPSQLSAVSDDVFADLGQAIEYAAQARLPFETVFFDFMDEFGKTPMLSLHFVEGGGADLGFELRGVVAGEDPRAEETVFLPIVGHPGEPPEEVGAVMVPWSTAPPPTAKPGRWRERVALPGDRELEVRMFSVSAAMEALGEAPRSVAGGLMGIARGKQGIPEEEIEFFRYSMATATASAVRMALKALYLLDSANVETVEMPLSRQGRRHASRKGKKISWTIAVRPSKKSREVEREQSSSFSHRFEVRGNFAHYRDGSWLYEHSPPEEIRACPRCGHCRRVWRQPHIKGPSDKPLAIKVRRIEFADTDPG